MHDIFTWQHLRYSVPIGNRQTRQLLDNISGYVAPGKLTALVGESGAGKVRFFVMYASHSLSYLAFVDNFAQCSRSKNFVWHRLWRSPREWSSSTSGFPSPDVCVRFIFAADDSQSPLFSSGYCQQMDTHLPTTTVREALLFSAKLRQPKSVPLAEKEA